MESFAQLQGPFQRARKWSDLLPWFPSLLSVRAPMTFKSWFYRRWVTNVCSSSKEVQPQIKAIKTKESIEFSIHCAMMFSVMRKTTLSLLVMVLLLVYTKSAYAYLDPGSGSLVLQVLLGG